MGYWIIGILVVIQIAIWIYHKSVKGCGCLEFAVVAVCIGLCLDMVYADLGGCIISTSYDKSEPVSSQRLVAISRTDSQLSQPRSATFDDYVLLDGDHCQVFTVDKTGEITSHSLHINNVSFLQDSENTRLDVCKIIWTNDNSKRPWFPYPGTYDEVQSVGQHYFVYLPDSCFGEE